MRLTDADELLTAFPLDDDEPRVTKWSLRMTIEHMPTIEPTITYEQVKEYCRKRNLVVVDSELFNEMKARWSAVPVVRCKDCKWRGEIGCAVTIVDDSDRPKDDDFCSWGERKEDE